MEDFDRCERRWLSCGSSGHIMGSTLCVAFFALFASGCGTPPVKSNITTDVTSDSDTAATDTAATDTAATDTAATDTQHKSPDTSVLGDAAGSAQNVWKKPSTNPILKENKAKGAQNFYATTKSQTYCGAGVGAGKKGQPCAIEGYAGQASVLNGQSLRLHVSGENVAYDVDIYRLGYYGGAGATLKAHYSGSKKATPQAKCPLDPKGEGYLMVRCSWTVTDTIVIGDKSWLGPATSGMYVAKLTVTEKGNGAAGIGYFIPFVVRAPITRSAEIAMVVPDMTWQAYNSWGGTSYYVGNKTCPPKIAKVCPSCCKNAKHPTLKPKATAVSFDRPYRAEPYPLQGAGFLGRWTYWHIFWLEQQGYNITYMSGFDLDNSTYGAPASLAKRYAMIYSSGHDEYWSGGMWDHLVGARDLGLHVAFFSANTAGWKVRFEGPAKRQMVSYKYHFWADPAYSKGGADMTGPWRPIDVTGVIPSGKPSKINRPDALLTGLSATDVISPWGSPKVEPGMSSHWVFDGLKLADGDVVANQLLGHESETDDAALRPKSGTVTVLAADRRKRDCSTNPLVKLDNVGMALWTQPGKGMTFNAGSIQWGWFLREPLGITGVKHVCTPLLVAACGCTKQTLLEPAPSRGGAVHDRIAGLTKNVLDCFIGRRTLASVCR